MSTRRVLHQRPTDAALRWTDADLKAFPELAVARCEWDRWRGLNVPTDAQLLRKLLMDLWVDFLISRHYGADLNTDDPSLRELNECIGGPILSAADYIENVLPVAEFLMQAERDVDANGTALINFILTGDV